MRSKEKIKERNRRIEELRNEGWTLQNIGIHFSISRQRVWQILEEVKKRHMSFSERARIKMRERGISASEFLDNLTEFLCDTEGLSTEELKEDLRAKGIDVDKTLAGVKALLENHGCYKAAEKMK